MMVSFDRAAPEGLLSPACHTVTLPGYPCRQLMPGAPVRVVCRFRGNALCIVSQAVSAETRLPADLRANAAAIDQPQLVAAGESAH
jgi:hypothetical protein